jgi:hypothetical protein
MQINLVSPASIYHTLLDRERQTIARGTFAVVLSWHQALCKAELSVKIRGHPPRAREMLTTEQARKKHTQHISIMFVLPYRCLGFFLCKKSSACLHPEGKLNNLYHAPTLRHVKEPSNCGKLRIVSKIPTIKSSLLRQQRALAPLEMNEGTTSGVGYNQL